MNITEGKETLNWADTIFPLENYKSVLYVGMHPFTLSKWGGDYFLSHIERYTKTKCTVVEINKKFIDFLSIHPIAKTHNFTFVHSSIQDFLVNTVEKFDCVIWWHGPEHLSKNTSMEIIKGFEDVCSNGVIILGCPCGHDPYDDGEDRHYWEVYPADFESLGFKTKLINRLNSPPAISAIKRIEKNGRI